jgi:hypothetical protein
LSKKLLLLFSLATFLSIVVLIGVSMEADRPIFSVTFDRAQWDRNRRSAEPLTDALQTRMARNLISKNFLIGKTKAEIIKLLGKPSTDSTTNKSTMRYPLRTKYDIIDPVRIDELIIDLDDRSIATQAKIEFRDL